MHPLPELRIDTFHKTRHALRDWLATQPKTPVPGLTTIMREPQKIKRLGTAISAFLSGSLCKSTKLNEPGFVRVQTQTEFLQPNPQIS